MGLGAYTARQHAKAPSFNDFTNTGMMRIFDQLPEHSTSSNALLYDGTESIQVTTLDRHLNETAHLLRATGKENIRIGFVKIDVRVLFFFFSPKSRFVIGISSKKCFSGGKIKRDVN